ncbi:Ig-like domain-containing protein [Rhodococcus sp. WMMA185]|uniref:Ig-like domain-containing protein n=1 Tax=Rhodococcus sp. WMMA185 TaxID=679318 RepID=UPI000879060A|nr:Ig-like domain-containing protein [Rhodococcus sp. WMMA185]
MFDKNIRRVIGGISAVAVTAGLAVTVGAGTASAASETITWTNSNTKFTRTISDVNPSEGDIITSKTKLERSAALEYIYRVWDYHPPCLTVESAKVDGKSQKLESWGDDWAKVEGSWVVQPLIGTKSRTFEFSYRVGADCDRNTLLTTGVKYEGSLIHRDQIFKDKGPHINVRMNSTSTDLAAPTDMQLGESTLLAATVTGGAQGDSVEFYDGNAKIGAAQLGSDLVATINWTASTTGNHSLSARFLATSKAEGSQSPVKNVSVSQTDIVSTTGLAPVVGAQVGQSTVLRATVSPTGPGGTVEFKDGGTTLGNVPVDDNGAATYTWVPSTSGDHSVTATFSGRAGVTGSTTSAIVNVAEAPAGNVDSTTALTIDGAPTVGVEQTITAQVNPSDAGGTVTFKVGDSVLGDRPVGPNGIATIQWTPERNGEHSITAEYSGAGNVNASTDQEIVNVGGADPGDGGNGSSGSIGNIFGS